MVNTIGILRIATAFTEHHMLSGALMPTPLKLSFAFFTALCLSSAAFAAPPTDNSDAEALAEKIDEKLSEHKIEIAKSSAKLKRKLEKGKAAADGDVAQEMEVVMDVLEEAFSEDGLFRDLGAMFGDFASDLDVVSDDGTTTLIFDGATVGQVKHKKSRDSEDRFSISGSGQNLSIDRENIVKDGKSKTRIIIEMDDDEEVEIILPKID